MIFRRDAFWGRLALGAVSLGVILALALAGCGGVSFHSAPVSGKVTLDGNPMADVQVLFQPAGSESGNPGPGSQGITDARGRFTLRTVDGSRKGAVPGKHKVILMYVDPNAPDEETGEGPDAEAAAPQFKLPPNARDGSLEFTVPEGGTDQANFELTSSGS
jgi:hypothetical protein